MLDEATEEAPLLEDFLPDPEATLLTWNTLARKPKAASIEMVSQEGPPEAEAGVDFSLQFFLLILAGGTWNSGPESEFKARLAGDFSLHFSRMDSNDFTTHSRVGAW